MKNWFWDKLVQGSSADNVAIAFDLEYKKI